MKCPKCGYHSFDHLDSCKKCSTDLVAHKEKFNLRGFYSPEQTEAFTPEPVVADTQTEAPGTDPVEPAEDDSVDFGFDFLEEEEETVPADEIELGETTQGLNIDQPFNADSETLPADSDENPDKGSEFSF